MDRRNQNPLLVGLINVLVSGSSHVVINQDQHRSIGTFIVGVMGFA
jgi:hypothetical protein